MASHGYNPRCRPTVNRIVFAALFALPVLPLSALDADKTAPAEVVFDHPENFTDVKDRYDDTESGRKGILDELGHFIVSTAKDCVPAGDRLTITFQDIDLAGKFEPWRGPPYENTRVIRSIYPPAFKFTYKVTDAAGHVLLEGQEHIRDIDFDTRITTSPDDRLRYEKDILKDWMQQKLRELKKS